MNENNIFKKLSEYFLKFAVALIIFFFGVTVFLSGATFIKSIEIFSVIHFTIGILLFLFLVLIVKNKLVQKITERKFVIAINIGSLALSIISVILFSSKLKGDPYDYYHAAINIIDGVQPYFTNGIFYKRTLPFFLPLFAISRSLIFISVINIILSLSTAFIFYKVLKKHIINVNIPRIFYILYTILPLRLTSLHFPSHDIPALFIFSVLLYAISALIHSNTGIRIKKGIFFSILFAILLLILEIQRSLGIITSLSIILFVAFNLIFSKFLHKHKKMGVILISSVILFFTLNSIFNKTLYNKDNSVIDITSPIAMIFSFNTPGSKGTYDDGAPLRYNYYTKFHTNAEALKFGISNYLNEFTYSFKEKSKVIVTKSFVLNNFRFFRYINYDNNSILKYRHNLYSEFSRSFRIFTFLFAIIGLSLLLFKKLTYNPTMSFLTIFFISFSFLLIFLSEVSSNYFNLISPVVLLYSSIGIVYFTQSLKTKFITMIEMKAFTQSLFSFITIFGLSISLILLTSYLMPFKTLSFKACSVSQVNSVIHKGNSDFKKHFELKFSPIINNTSIQINKKTNFKNLKFFIEHPNSTGYILTFNTQIIKTKQPFENNTDKTINSNDLIRIKNSQNCNEFAIKLQMINASPTDTMLIKYLYID